MSVRRKFRPQVTTDSRSPDERLESLVREPNLDRAERMIARIQDGLDDDPEPGPWIAAARTLSERLIISENAFYHLVGLFTECLIFAASGTDPELQRIRDEILAVQRAHGLRADESFYLDDAPEDWLAVNTKWDRRADAIIAARLRELGHADVATLLETDRDEFTRRAELGEAELWGDDEKLDPV
jgi:hypothetical protein